MDEFEAFGVELGLLGLQEGTFVAAGCFELVEHQAQDRTDSFRLRAGDRVGAVGVFDALIDALGVDSGAGAAVLSASSGVGEVLVALSGLVAGAFDHELGPAGAVHTPLR
ncbi:hypothetical protein [Cellulosimicrobium cellulans]|uniref:hypothetical protein n=1 Tax=Cellulosimicrobium cellulans TaxID=1710 RepID=UPI001483AAF9|nr:hypothetical protein [Cellulosimicrobium cellulans]